ncbi:serine/threonine-protein kinase 31-like isoform X2 [Branchiostoma floridae]|uniref:Serine/threonine-protein kinase 31-like isoform X2 n=1 Tax=Branchiostoma floridae TaxID=7739 RepID=A0A9J7MIW5_BRAFL|nr:serine/threonine-protein kinase 31-like isoform X2 [Branchiostoma floridae]
MSGMQKSDVGPSKHNGTDTYDVFVGGLPDTATDRLVKTRFNTFGEIHSIAVFKGKYPGTKVAFVRFFSKLDADKAVMETNGETFDGKFLMVRRTQVREQSSEENNNKPSSGRGNWNKEHHLRNATNGSSAVAPGMEERQVFVTQVDDVCTFWGQNMKVGEKIVQFSEELQNVCPKGLPLTSAPKPRQLYGAKFAEDEQWYRCRVINMVSDDQALVQYVDYGNTETIQWREIHQLPLDFATLPPYAERYRLTGMVPAAQDQEQGVEFLKKLIENQAVQVKVRATPDDGPIDADVTVGGVDVGQSLVEKGFIVQRPVKRSPVQPTPRTAEMVDRSMGDNRDGQRLDQVESLKGKLADMENCIKVFIQEKHTLQDQMNKQHNILELQALEIQEKQKKLDDVQKMVQEKDMALQQLRAEIQEKDKLIDNSISHQIQAVGVQVTKVKLSRKEMPVEQEVPDPIQKAIAMVTDKKQRVGAADIQSVLKVSAALGTLKNLQEQITAWGEKDDTLTRLIAERNDARRDAQTAITECVEEMQNLPLESRLCSLQDTVSSIEETYKKYVSSDGTIGGKASTETFQTFIEWRSQKAQSLQSLRRATDQHCKEVCHELKAVVQSLTSLLTGEPGNDVDTDSPGNSLSELLSDFSHVMEQELTDSRVEEGADVKLMTKVVNMLLNDLRGEIADIHKLQGLLARNLKCKEDMSRWITNQPDLEPLRLVKKEIRALKSEIRHKMADKQDLEEEGCTGAQLQQVESQLLDLRAKIQDAFIREHQLMEAAATHAGSHFPELPLMYPELNLAPFMENNGLVKVGWELDHYNMSSVPLALTRGSAAAILTTFNNNPVVVKEYIIEGGEGSERSKKAILARAKEFHSFKHPSLISVEAIFFSKTMRQMYVQMPYYLGSSLTELQDSNPLNNLETFLVLKGILEGLYHLHSRGVSHGAVTPQYVLAPGRTQGILDNYDFAKTPTQRAATLFQTPNGLSFVPPEVAKGESASAASDMYQFGVLVLWVCCPADNFSSTDLGVPNLGNITLDVGLLEFLPRLLQANSSTRPTADRLLQLKFFKDPPAAKVPLPDQPKSPVLLLSHVQDLSSRNIEVESTHHLDTISINQAGSSPTTAAFKPDHSVLPLRTCVSPPTSVPGLPTSPPPRSPVVKDCPTSLPRPLSPQLTSIASRKTSPLINLANITAAVMKETEKVEPSTSALEKEGVECSAGQQKPNAEAKEVPSPASKERLHQQHLDILKAKGAHVLIQYDVSSPDLYSSPASLEFPAASKPHSATKSAEEPTVCDAADDKPTAAVSNPPAECDPSETSQDADLPLPAGPPATSMFTTSMRASLEAAYQSLGLLMSPTKRSSTSSQQSSSATNSNTSCLEETMDSPITESTDLEASMAGTSSPVSLSPPPSPLRTTPEMVEQQSSPLAVGMGGLSSQLTRSMPSSYYSPNKNLPALLTDTGLDGPDHCD